MIRIIVAISLLFISIPLIGNTQTTDISALSDYEKSLHRWAWCEVVAFSLPTFGVFDKGKITAISILLFDNKANSRSKDPNKIFQKARRDTEKQLILNEIVITQDLLNDCDRDMKLILKENYIPNFSYLSE